MQNHRFNDTFGNTILYTKTEPFNNYDVRFYSSNKKEVKFIGTINTSQESLYIKDKVHRVKVDNKWMLPFRIKFITDQHLFDKVTVVSKTGNYIIPVDYIKETHVVVGAKPIYPDYTTHIFIDINKFKRSIK